MTDNSTQRVQRALPYLASGRSVVLVGNDDYPDSLLLLAAEKATASSIAFVVRHSSGFICASIASVEAARLHLPPMAGTRPQAAGEDFTVTVDAIDGVGTGISAGDRARTLRALADTESSGDAFTRPGHVAPVVSRPGGVLTRPGAAEAVTDLLRIAGLNQVGVYATLVSPHHQVRNAGPDEARDFAARHDVGWVCIDDVVLYRRSTETHVRKTFEIDDAGATEPRWVRGYRSAATDMDYVVHRTVVPRTVVPRTGEPTTKHAVTIRVHDGSNATPSTATDGGLTEACVSDIVISQCSPRADAPCSRAGAADVAQIVLDLGIGTPVMLNPTSELIDVFAEMGVLI